MPRPYTTMRQIRNVLRLHFGKKLSVRDTALSLAMARSTVADYLNRARVAGLTWPLSEEMDDDQLERCFFPETVKVRSTYLQPDYETMKKDLAKKGVTLQLLWSKFANCTPTATATPSSVSVTTFETGQTPNSRNVSLEITSS